MRAIAEILVSWEIIGNALDIPIGEWKLAAMAGLLACLVKIAR